jgi:phosphoribosylformylglycinamidine synthase
MKFGVITFPGSNSDEDAFLAVTDVLGQEGIKLWHKDHDLRGADVVILPGGFSYGDYLRCGAIARFSPIMRAVQAHADAGKPVIGICNGFQILTEADLLPGALHRNTGLQFVCRPIHVRVENNDTIFTRAFEKGQVLTLPIAHNEGNFFADQETAQALEDGGQVIFRYCDADGNVTDEANPNGSVNNIAGIINAAGNVLGLMPHPERACEPLLGGDDGRGVFESLLMTE